MKLVDILKLVGTGLSIVCCLAIRGSTAGGFLMLRYFSGAVSHPRDRQMSQYFVHVESSYLTHHMPNS